jgi:hypothetical protein
MRVAISGTHCSGKSTLIDEFLAVHRDFAHEPEPYEALQEEYGVTFAAEPRAEDFLQQLEHNVDRLRQYGSSDRVIFERSPADFIAYLYALSDVGRDRNASLVAGNSLEMAREGIRLLDLIVFLPAEDLPIDIGDSEDPELRNAVDSRLESILIDDDLHWFASGRPVIHKASGTTAQRLLESDKVLKTLIRG